MDKSKPFETLKFGFHKQNISLQTYMDYFSVSRRIS